MQRITLFFLTLILAVAFATQANAQFILDDSGMFTIRSFNVVGGGGSNDNDLNTTVETGNVWAHLDANPGFTGTTPNLSGSIYNVANNNTSLASVVNYDGGNFGGDIAYPDGNYGGTDFSYRAQTLLEFTVGGTYTIGSGSDDGRSLTLTEALPGSAPGWNGVVDSVTGQDGGNNLPGGGAGTNFFGTNQPTGHNNNRGEFTVAAGDILALDGYFFERGGGDSYEVFIAQGGIGQGYTGNFQILQDNLFNGAIQLHTSIEAVVPEPATIAIWSLLGLMLAGFGYRRYRAK